MGCLGCSTCSSNGIKGCQSNGGCGSGGCNRLNTYDWLSHLEIEDISSFNLVEVSFKNGSRKGFFRVPDHVRTVTGDMAVVETGNGYDVGKITLSGELVRLQMKRKKVSESSVTYQVLRCANERDLERLQEAREEEGPMMVRARAIARTLGLDMKVGDVEIQGDKRKATFFYTADGRVDFRELIRHFAKEFRVKIEMRQIGARQESARIGGIGSCGRELCCSTWLSDFKSVSTAAARYQNLAINQSKLSGQCGRLKCCLNYELDTYMEALEAFPENADRLETEKGRATLIKTDIFKQLMYYVYDFEKGRGQVYPLNIDKVKEIKAMNLNGAKPADFEVAATVIYHVAGEEEVGFADVTGEIELPEERKKRKKKKKNRPQNRMEGPPPPGGPRPEKRPSDPRNQGKDQQQRDERDQRNQRDQRDQRNQRDQRDQRDQRNQKDQRSKPPHNQGPDRRNKDKDDKKQ